MCQGAILIHKGLARTVVRWIKSRNSKLEVRKFRFAIFERAVKYIKSCLLNWGPHDDIIKSSGYYFAMILYHRN